MTAKRSGRLMLAGAALGDERMLRTAERLGDFLMRDSIMTGGNRAEPDHPAFGLIGWNDVPGYHRDMDGFGVYYGGGRTMLGVAAAAAALKIDARSWEPLEPSVPDARLARRVST